MSDGPCVTNARIGVSSARLRTSYQEGMAGLPSEAGSKAEAVRAGLQAKQDKRSAAAQALSWPF
jgi:hypothetical protein